MNSKPTVLVVDDVELNRAFLNDMLKDEYHIIEATDGLQAVNLLEQCRQQIDVVLLDLVMPVMDGFEVLEIMNQKHWIENIPVIMISAATSSNYTDRSFALGVVDYISRPFDSCIIRHRIKNTIMFYSKQHALQKLVQQQVHEKEKYNSLMIDALCSIAEFRNGESISHIRRVRTITEILLKAFIEKHPEYPLTSSDITAISNAAALHDIGKIAIPEEILNKPGRLDPEEFETMKRHSAIGADIITQMHLKNHKLLIRYAHDICRWHHEKWDGKGYPDGLSGNEIPLCAQVVSLADVYDVLVNKRVYKPAYSHKKAMQMIMDGECGQFNPELLKCLISKNKILSEGFMEDTDSYQASFDVEEISKELIGQKAPESPSDRTMLLLERERVKYQFLASLSNEILFEYDTKSDALTFSEQGHIELGLEIFISNVRQRRGQIHILSEKDAKDIWEKIFSTTVDNPLLKLEYLVNTPSGEQLWYKFIIRSLWTNDLEPLCIGFIGKMNNIHHQKLEADRLRNLAEKDSMTGLYNKATARRLVTSLLSGLSLQQSAALLFFDLDNFKQANDTRGHAFGDSLLKHVAEILHTNIRQDDIAARLGGDEFMVFLGRIHSRADIEKKAAQLCSALNSTFEGYTFSASIGIAVYDQDGDSFDLLLYHADIALYDVKRNRKGKYMFYQGGGDTTIRKPSS